MKYYVECLLYHSTGRKPDKRIAWGNAPGNSNIRLLRPVRAKALYRIHPVFMEYCQYVCQCVCPNAFALAGRHCHIRHIPMALPWAICLLGFQSVFILSHLSLQCQMNIILLERNQHPFVLGVCANSEYTAADMRAMALAAWVSLPLKSLTNTAKV